MPFKTIFKYYWMQIRKYKWSFYGVFVVFGLSTILSNILIPLIYREIIDVISSASVRIDMQAALFILLYQLAVLVVLMNLLYRAGEYMTTYFQVHVIKELADFSFQQIEKHSYSFFSNTFSGGLVAKVGRFVRAFEGMHDTAPGEFWTPAIVLVGVFVVLFQTNATLGFYFLIWLLVYFFVVVMFVRKRIPYNLVEATKDSRVTARIADFFTNILNVKMFSARMHEFSSFGEVTQERLVAQSRGWNLQNFQNAVQGLLLGIFEVGGIYFAVKLWLDGEITGGTVVLVQIYTHVIFGHVWGLGRSITRFTKYLSDAAEMVEIFEQPIEVLDPIQPEISRIEKGKVVFENITFGYNATNPVLKNFTLTVHAG
ncbi:ABC transporter ATP-binding protein/permease, partial [bacterium]|nr:ABC transporter ATP-binding protein/permease [bacterium]